MKRVKKILALSLAFIMMFSTAAFADEPSADDLIEGLKQQIASLQGDNNYLQEQVTALTEKINDLEALEKIPENPIIMITDPLIIEIEAGQSKTVELNIRNLTSFYAKNIVTTVTKDSIEKGIVAKFSDNDAMLSSLGNKASKKTKATISVDSSVKEGNYILTFNHTFINSLNETKTTESIISVRVKNSSASSSVGISDISSSQGQIVPGSDFNLSAIIKNEGTTGAKNLTLAIEGMSSDTIFLKNSTSIVDIATLKANASENVSIQMTSSAKAKKGSYPLTLTLSYEDSTGETQKKTYTYYVNVSGGAQSDEAAQVIITSISAPSSTIGVGSEFTMKLNIKNASDFEAKNIKISARPEGEGAIVPKSTSITQIPTLAAWEDKELTFSFAPTTSSKSQNYVVGFTLEYETGAYDDDGKAEINTFTQYQGVNVSNPEADKKTDTENKTSVPKIIISDYSADPIIVKAGHEFDLSMTFLNTNSQKEIRNIKVYLTVDEGTDKKGSVFSPVNSSNTFYIDSIDPKGEITKTIRLYTIPDASPKTYTINVNFEYEDAEHNEYKSVEMVGINVKQVTELKTSDISISEYGMLWSPIYVNFEFYNTGKVTLSNLMITVEGNFEANQKSVYYGSFSSSSTEYYDNQIMPTEEGTQSGAIVISYEDDTGEKIVERKEFTVEVSPMPVYDPGEEMPNMGMENMVWDEKLGMFVEAKQGIPTPILIGGGIGLAVVIIGAAVVIIKKKRKQGSIDLDE